MAAVADTPRASGTIAPVKVLAMVGTRPDAIKMAPVIRALLAGPGQARVRVCATAQHRELLDRVLDHFGIVPDIDLAVMREDQAPAGVAGSILSHLAPIIRREHPDWVVVQGDTTTTLAAALGAFYEGCAVAHVEAGLRSRRVDQPFPEEMNRLLVSRLATLHFAPTPGARANLLSEGVDATHIHVTGNTAIDALQWTLAQQPALPASISVATTDRLVFVTVHRRESFGAPLDGLADGLLALADRSPTDVRLVVTVHPNPNVAGVLRRRLAGHPRIALLDPLDYPQAVALLARCHFVITDSGGLQEEAPALGKPVLVLRDVTERPEGPAAGVASLIGRDPDRLVTAGLRLLTDDAAYGAMAQQVSPYGDGHAADRIAAILHAFPPARHAVVV
jgi:UDP-N-acetylglucosamine 2-epimerase (non-hydrolysing)